MLFLACSDGHGDRLVLFSITKNGQWSAKPNTIYASDDAVVTDVLFLRKHQNIVVTASRDRFVRV